MATQAAARQAQVGSAPKPKILRIGIIQGGRIVEERLVRKRENITIGQSAKNMFVVPSDALPRNWMLFEASGSQYVAHFSDGMDARIAVGNEIISLSQLKQTGKIQKKGASWPLPLDERSRGKISLADMTILFQFVTPPPPQPRPQLPASVRGSALTGVDWFFTTIAAISFLFHLIFIIYLRSVDWPRKPDIEAVPDRFVQMVVKKPEEPKKVEEKKPTEEKKAEEKKPEKKKGSEEEAKKPKHELTDEEKAKLAEEKAKADAERRARLADQVKQTGLLKLLGAKADGEGLNRRRARQGRRRPRPGEGVPGRRRRRRGKQQRPAARHQVGRHRLGARGQRRRPARRRRHRGRRHRRGGRPRRRSRAS